MASGASASTCLLTENKKKKNYLARQVHLFFIYIDKMQGN